MIEPRSDSAHAARSVTWVGVLANSVLIVFKFFAGLFGQSQALIADGVHSFSDLFTDVVVLVGLTIGTKAPDENHHFGHARVETLASAIVGLALITTGMVGSREMAQKGHEDPGMVIQDSAAHAAQIEADRKIYEKVASFEEQGRHAEAMTVLSGIMEKHPGKSLSFVHLARLNMSQGQLVDSVQN